MGIPQAVCTDLAIRESQMNLQIYECLESTQTFLLQGLKSGDLHAPVCVSARRQTHGIGSRGNVWEEQPNALYFSFALPLNVLPEDLKLESASIYFGFLCKELLREFGSQVWLKWPNDLYIGEQKIGGVLCNKWQDYLVCGIGINLYAKDPKECGGYATLEPEISALVEPRVFLNKYFASLEKKPSWKQIFRFYALEFQNNFSFSFHHNGKEVSFRDAQLLEDGAICVDAQIVYSCR